MAIWIAGYPVNTTNGKTQQFNFTVERQIPNRVAMEGEQLVVPRSPCRSTRTIRSKGASSREKSSFCACAGISGIRCPTSTSQSWWPNVVSRWMPAAIWRWVQAYAPELNKRCRPHLKPTNKSYRIDETYINVKGEDKYLYRALDSTGQTIDFLLTAKRDTAAAKRFLRRAIEASGNPMPRVMNVDKNPAYPAALEELKADGSIPRRVRLRQCKYLNNVIEQDHRTVKKRVWLAKGYGSFHSAWRTLQGIETASMIRKGRVRWLAKGDAVGQARFIGELFGLSA